MWKYLHQAKLVQKNLFSQLESATQNNYSEQNQFLSHHFQDQFSFSCISNLCHNDNQQALGHSDSQINNRNSQCTIEIHYHGQTFIIQQLNADGSTKDLTQIRHQIESQTDKKVSESGLAKIADILQIPFETESKMKGSSVSLCNRKQSLSTQKESIANEYTTKTNNACKNRIAKVAGKQNTEKGKSYFQQYKSKRN